MNEHKGGVSAFVHFDSDDFVVELIRRGPLWIYVVAISRINTREIRTDEADSRRRAQD